MVAKHVRAACTQEFRLEAVRLVQSWQSQMQVCHTLGIPKAGLGSWVRQVKAGTLKPGVADGTASKVTLEQMELARLRAENARLCMERNIAKKRLRTSRRTCCEVCLDLSNEVRLSDCCFLPCAAVVTSPLGAAVAGNHGAVAMNWY